MACQSLHLFGWEFTRSFGMIGNKSCNLGKKLESLADVAKIKGAIGNRQKTTRISDRVINRLISYQTLRNSRELGDQIAFGRPIGCQTQPIRVSFRVIIDRGGAPI